MLIHEHQRAETESIATHLGMSKDRALYFLQILNSKAVDLICPGSNMDGDQWWNLTQKGREYLEKRGLLR